MVVFLKTPLPTFALDCSRRSDSGETCEEGNDVDNSERRKKKKKNARLISPLSKRLGQATFARPPPPPPLALALGFLSFFFRGWEILSST